MKRPDEETEPPVADQVTAVLLLPVTVTVNCCVPPVNKDAEMGESEIATAVVVLTPTTAEADWLVLATLVAVTM